MAPGLVIKDRMRASTKVTMTMILMTARGPNVNMSSIKADTTPGLAEKDHANMKVTMVMKVMTALGLQNESPIGASTNPGRVYNDHTNMQAKSTSLTMT